MSAQPECILANARVVTGDSVIERGHVVLRGGTIVAVGDGAVPAGAVDLEGDFLVPGLVELHTDNLEKHVSPRPGVRWHSFAAVMAHDAQIAASGITTVLDAIAVGETAHGSDRLENLEAMVDHVGKAQAEGITRAEHLLHLRCEVSHVATADLFDALSGHALLRMVSIMDHTPGQRQFTSIEKYRQYYRKKYAFTDEEFRAFVERQTRAHHENSAANRARIIERSHALGLAIASHDDATTAHVEAAVSDGMTIAEFPTTVEAASLSRENGLAILMGAPNLVRGGSHSGNVSAAELAQRGLLDILSSDYVPASLLHAAFALGAAADRTISLPQAVATVSRNPARSIGLDDRGEIAPGQRADLVRVRLFDDLPLVRAVWREGARVI